MSETPSWLELFRWAGASAYLALTIAVASIVLALIALLGRSSARSLLGGIALGGAAATMLTGVVGRARGREMVAQAIVAVDPVDRERVREQGNSEADANLPVAAAFAFLPAMLGVGALLSKRQERTR